MNVKGEVVKGKDVVAPENVGGMENLYMEVDGAKNSPTVVEDNTSRGVVDGTNAPVSVVGGNVPESVVKGIGFIAPESVGNKKNFN